MLRNLDSWQCSFSSWSSHTVLFFNSSEAETKVGGTISFPLVSTAHSKPLIFLSCTLRRGPGESPACPWASDPEKQSFCRKRVGGNLLAMQRSRIDNQQGAKGGEMPGRESWGRSWEGPGLKGSFALSPLEVTHSLIERSLF